MEPLGYGCFAGGVLVSHGYIHLVEYGCPVTIAGVVINPGDLLFCDSQGVVTIPDEIAPHLADACRRIAAAELPVLDGTRRARIEGREVDVTELMGWVSRMQALRGK